MKVKPMLGEWEIPNIAAVETAERRALVELPVPGRVGSLYQDLNSVPVRITVRGSVFGDPDRDAFLQTARGQFAAGQPVTFVADILTATQVQYVLIERLHFEESGAVPDQTGYTLVLRESPPPPPPPDPLGGLDAGLLEQAGAFMDTVTGALDAITALGSIPELGDPARPFQEALTDVRGATAGLDTVAGSLRGLFGV